MGLSTVNKTLQEWGYQPSAKCPRCNKVESAAHVYKCTGCGASEVWDKSISKVKATLRKLQTDPAISEALLQCLQHYRQHKPLQLLKFPEHVRPAIQEQHQIGWRRLLESLPSKRWQQLQHHHYHLLGTRRSSKVWIRRVLTSLHHLAWHQWEHRNDIKHKIKQTNYKAALQSLHNEIIREYTLGTTTLLEGDHHHLQVNLATLLQKSLPYKKNWLANVATSRQRFLRRQANNDELQTISREHSYLLKWMRREAAFE